mmetsp:Transcript_10202/g.20446  ORF Transcript_10202/g.20446 Transcript_10202/m.20446 type:complete len:471 (-) Transcript_10202:444-1856(-)
MSGEGYPRKGASFRDRFHGLGIHAEEEGFAARAVQGHEEQYAIILGRTLSVSGDHRGFRWIPVLAAPDTFLAAGAQVVLDNCHRRVGLRVRKPLDGPVEAVGLRAVARVDAREVRGSPRIAQGLHRHGPVSVQGQAEALHEVPAARQAAVAEGLRLCRPQRHVRGKGVLWQRGDVDHDARGVLVRIHRVDVPERRLQRQRPDEASRAVQRDDVECVPRPLLRQLQLLEGRGHRLHGHLPRAELHGHAGEHRVVLSDAEGVHVGRGVHRDVRDALALAGLGIGKLEQPDGGGVAEDLCIADEVDPSSGPWIPLRVRRACVADQAFQVVVELLRSRDPEGLAVHLHHGEAVRQREHLVAKQHRAHVGVVIRSEGRHVADGAEVPRLLPRRLGLEEEEPRADGVCFLRLVEEASGHVAVRRLHAAAVDAELLHLAEAIEEADELSVAHLEKPNARDDEVALGVRGERLRDRSR